MEHNCRIFRFFLHYKLFNLIRYILCYIVILMAATDTFFVNNVDVYFDMPVALTRERRIKRDVLTDRPVDVVFAPFWENSRIRGSFRAKMRVPLRCKHWRRGVPTLSRRVERRAASSQWNLNEDRGGVGVGSDVAGQPGRYQSLALLVLRCSFHAACKAFPISSSFSAECHPPTHSFMLLIVKHDKRLWIIQ